VKTEILEIAKIMKMISGYQIETIICLRLKRAHGLESKKENTPTSRSGASDGVGRSVIDVRRYPIWKIIQSSFRRSTPDASIITINFASAGLRTDFGSTIPNLLISYMLPSCRTSIKSLMTGFVTVYI
jgi:hypothetical protein